MKLNRKLIALSSDIKSLIKRIKHTYPEVSVRWGTNLLLFKSSEKDSLLEIRSYAAAPVYVLVQGVRFELIRNLMEDIDEIQLNFTQDNFQIKYLNAVQVQPEPVRYLRD